MGMGMSDVASILPPYLKEERKEGFLKALKDFPDAKPLYASQADPEPLQGDGWSKFPVINFATGAIDYVKGMIMSNSCDMSAENKRVAPAWVSYAPIISAQAYYQMLLREGYSTESADSHLKDVKAQRVSSLFFLPRTGGLSGDAIAVLEQVQSVPLDVYLHMEGRGRDFSLSDVGFWLFLFKISYHFCRFHENIDRTPEDKSETSL